jgi:dipeptidase D
LKRSLNDLEPAAVWLRFSEILEIPRPSGHEEGIADFLSAFAARRGLSFDRDVFDNVIIRKDGSGACADRDGVALQAHVDMVAEKNPRSGHDFLLDPIRASIDGDRVWAPETTLGADNGIGVALMLAVLDSGDMTHPPLECLFTVDEERGLIGASRFPTEWITAKRLINLDSENDSSFCIGCAGGMDITLTSCVRREDHFSYRPALSLVVEGLRGGHSGIEIGLNRASALRILGRALDRLSGTGSVRIIDLEGGSKRNAIPRGARAVIALDPEAVEEADRIVHALEADVIREYDGLEDGIAIRLSGVRSDRPPLDARCSQLITDMLLGLPHGVQKMNGRVEGLVETSVNFAIAALGEKEIEFVLSVRSSLEPARGALIGRISAITRLAGFEAECSDGYPGWTPDPDSKLLSTCIEVYRNLIGRDPKVEIIHAGLECGLIGSRIGGLDMISAGPDIHGVHVPGESVSISSLARFWKFLAVLLENLE